MKLETSDWKKKVLPYGKEILGFVLCFLFFLLFYLFYRYFSSDEMWNFGYCYEIAMGKVPYRDFNMVVTPFFAFLSGGFLKIFGKNIFVFLSLQALIDTLIVFVVKIWKKEQYLAIFFLSMAIVPSYNHLLLLLFLLILLLENQTKKKDFWIGILVGLSILTKQTVGVALFLASLYQTTKEEKKKRIAAFLFPLLLFACYLLFTHSWSYFINYSFLGLFSFAKRNLNLKFALLFMGILLFLVGMFKKSHWKDKNIFYLLAFQSIACPIFDQIHLTFALFPVAIYFAPQIFPQKQWLSVTFLLLSLITFLFNTRFSYVFPNDFTVFRYRALSEEANTHFQTVIRFVEEKKNQYEIFFLDNSAYLYKIESGLAIHRFDIILNGNIGLHGSKDYENYVKKTCQKKDCLFLIGANISQANPEIIHFVRTNFTKVDTLSWIDIYQNEKAS